MKRGPQLADIVKGVQVINLDSSSDEDNEYASFATEDTSSYEDESDASKENEDEVEDAADCKRVRNKGSVIAAEDVPDEEMVELIKGDPKEISLKVCQSYLRRHGLRLSGNKSELLERMKQHIQLKKEGPRKYHLATFLVNCTGDVCKGDVVLFVQKIHAKLGASAGWRRVAGRVVRENYGDKRQQHTFTIEVIWSSGYKPLMPMSQLLVKGRNLYKKGTRRQMWPDEQARRRILDEKHSRGDVARQLRENSLRLKGRSRHAHRRAALVTVQPVAPLQGCASSLQCHPSASCRVLTKQRNGSTDSPLTSPTQRSRPRHNVAAFGAAEKRHGKNRHTNSQRVLASRDHALQQPS